MVNGYIKSSDSRSALLGYYPKKDKANGVLEAFLAPLLIGDRLFSLVENVSNLPGRRERISKSSDADDRVAHP